MGGRILVIQPKMQSSSKTALRAVVAVGLIICALLAMSAFAAAAEPTVKVAYSPTLGHYLVGPNDMTLYLFTRDQPGMSACSGRCIGNWPALTVESKDDLQLPEGLAGTLDVITRADDGKLQVTYNGMPLYYWVQDQKPGDTTGQAVNNVWYVVNPAPTLRVAESPELGKYLIDGTGMTVYLYTRDEQGKTNCYGRCAGNWPPIIVSYGEPVAGEGVDASAISLVQREDGSMQVAYKGMPLYGWIRDEKMGDTTGQGVSEVWYVVAP